MLSILARRLQARDNSTKCLVASTGRAPSNNALNLPIQMVAAARDCFTGPSFLREESERLLDMDPGVLGHRVGTKRVLPAPRRAESTLNPELVASADFTARTAP
jgi:hypothetical protein